MKYLLILTALSSTANACNQKVYDQIYKSIIQEMLASKPTRENFLRKNQTIFNLRALCDGQRSTFEILNTIGGGK